MTIINCKNKKFNKINTRNQKDVNGEILNYLNKVQLININYYKDKTFYIIGFNNYGSIYISQHINNNSFCYICDSYQLKIKEEI